MKTSKILSYGVPILRTAALLFAIGLAGCNSGGGGGGGAAGGGGGAPTAGVNIQGPEGSAISIPADPNNIVPVNATIDLSQTVSLDADGYVSVHFFVKDAQDNGISLTQNPVELRLYVSELVTDPNAKVDPGPAWVRRVYEHGTPADAEDQLPGSLTVIDGTTGEYSYQMADALAASSNPFRVTVRVRYRATIDDVRYYIVNAANASYDFLQADPGTQLAASGADMADTNACNSCHGDAIGYVGHHGYTEVKSCDNCHNLDYQESRNGGEGDLAFMVHRIHSAGTFASLHGGADFSEVTYPQKTSTCDKCHNDNAPNADLAFTNPTRRNCGSCHANVNFATGENHAGGVFTDDSLCSACHQKTGSEINGGIPGNDHKSMIAGSGLAASTANTPEYTVDIGMTDPANGSYYEAGEMPTVTVTLTPNDGGPAANYAAAADAKGDRDGNLSGASLFVYGPRSDAVPVLTWHSSTDPSWTGVPVQGHSLFVGADPQVMTDGSGFKYKLMNIDALEPGTYMVRFEGNDYGANSDSDYVTSSTAVTTFQVGQAEEEPKVSGSGCLNCHGATHMHLEGAHPHNQPFNTDGCLACHDRSTGNYGDYIGNRVHAVHSGSETGDLGPHAFEGEITYPQDVNNCSVCHTNAGAETPVWRTTNPVACAGCHGGDPNAQDTDEQIAASHMILQGAATTADGKIDAEQGATPGCLVCHGAGKEVDLYVRHNLVNYSVPNDASDDQ